MLARVARHEPLGGPRLRRGARAYRGRVYATRTRRAAPGRLRGPHGARRRERKGAGILALLHGHTGLLPISCRSQGLHDPLICAEPLVTQLRVWPLSLSTQPCTIEVLQCSAYRSADEEPLGRAKDLPRVALLDVEAHQGLDYLRLLPRAAPLCRLLRPGDVEVRLDLPFHPR